MTDGRVSNVAEYAIAKSSSWHGGAHQCDRSFADELPMGPRSRASHNTSDTASLEGGAVGPLAPHSQGAPLGATAIPQRASRQSKLKGSPAGVPILDPFWTGPSHHRML